VIGFSPLLHILVGAMAPAPNRVQIVHAPRIGRTLKCEDNRQPFGYARDEIDEHGTQTKLVAETRSRDVHLQRMGGERRGLPVLPEWPHAT
jgi:hypothetical protein